MSSPLRLPTANHTDGVIVPTRRSASPARDTAGRPVKLRSRSRLDRSRVVPPRRPRNLMGNNNIGNFGNADSSTFSHSPLRGPQRPAGDLCTPSPFPPTFSQRPIRPLRPVRPSSLGHRLRRPSPPVGPTVKRGRVSIRRSRQRSAKRHAKKLGKVYRAGAHRSRPVKKAPTKKGGRRIRRSRK